MPVAMGMRRAQQERRQAERLPPMKLVEPEGAIAQFIKLRGGLGDRRPRLVVELGSPDADSSDVHRGLLPSTHPGPQCWFALEATQQAPAPDTPGVFAAPRQREDCINGWQPACARHRAAGPWAPPPGGTCNVFLVSSAHRSTVGLSEPALPALLLGVSRHGCQLSSDLDFPVREPIQTKRAGQWCPARFA